MSIEQTKATYFLDHAQLSWCGVLFGFERDWLNWKDVVPLAAVNAQAVLEYLNGTKQPQMPPGEPYWSDDQLKLFTRWMEQGRRP